MAPPVDLHAVEQRRQVALARRLCIDAAAILANLYAGRLTVVEAAERLEDV